MLWMVLLLYSAPVYAEVFQYFDQDGTLVVTDNPYRTRKARPATVSRPSTDNRSSADSGLRDIKLNFREDVFYDYYQVYGRNFEEALQSTRVNGPFDSKDNKTYTGQTKWNIGWSYKYNTSYRADGTNVYVSLNIYDIEFRSDITVLLPLLNDYASFNPHELPIWERYMQGLLEHEHDHVKIIKDSDYKTAAVREISAIRDLTLPFNPRMNLDAQIREAVESRTAIIGHDLIMKIKDRNEEYDRLTDHGLKPEMRGVFFGGQ